MKKLKKIISLAVAFGIVTSFGSFNSFAESISAEEEMRNQVLAEYQGDYMFQQMRMQDFEAAQQYISDEVTKRLSPNLLTI